MSTISLSSKFQIVIPRELRRALMLTPGQKLDARLVGERIELTPIKPMSSMRGLFAGIDTQVADDDHDMVPPQA
jgi:AbrB family looped-hinge helix DNA binding protein